ncbi:MAG: efflux RND transporter periplasmic adaptor subunit [Flavobacteriales bacterium]|nr:efflux RND transporter periplasmic adaptor subunit [Flavobacteriales bacterium]MCX7650006.1 efflux RND transporter periplasmic adaptor subunit [Flavobacteriales bacterium]MDW8432013.1 efflux RND transporter periplasmic adaptor subunit [Flavobacteriales bacterium]
MIHSNFFKININFLLWFSLAFSFLPACHHKGDKEPVLTELEVTTPWVKDTLVYKEYVCQIRSIQHIELRALEKGYLQEIFVDEGKAVRKGQMLFQLMPVIYQADVQKAQAEVNFAEIEYQNTKALADSGVVSRTELALVKARLDKAKADLALAQAHLQFTAIRAPFDGIVGRFNDVRLGSLVDEGELLTTLSDNSKMWVYFNVPEVEYLEFASQKKIREDLRVKLRLANNTLYPIEGLVETIEADFNRETGNIAFRATFPNPSGLLRNGETGTVLFPLWLKRALLIPQKCTFEVLDKKFVFVVDDHNVVHAREIKVQGEIPHLYVVQEGLKPNEKVLLEGLRKVNDGDSIRPRQVSVQQVIKSLEELHAE